jgi:hypothetical protein
MSTRRGTAGIAALTATLLACTTIYRAKFTNPESAASLDVQAPFLKCHMNDGSVYVLQRWTLDAPNRIVHGSGLLYGPQREVVQRGAFNVAADDVALFETNYPETFVHEGYMVLAVLTSASLVVTALCATNPKACFGSCPTFYAWDGEHESLQAEGFSSSIARALEATDVDAMWTARPRGATFDVRMTNDALETHAVDSVRLLTAPRPAGGRVLRAGDAYYPATHLTAPSSCTSGAGSCLAAVATTDGQEYKSDSDAKDLATHETLDLTFEGPAAGRRGLLLVARNSLLNTFLLYQALAYMGRTAGERFAALDRTGPSGVDSFRGLSTILGGIRVKVETSPDQWTEVGTYDEVGPIALEAQVVPLPPDLHDGPTHVRLELTRGYWRIEQVALAALGDPVVPTAIEPRAVLRGSESRPDAAAKLRPGGEHLVTGPGDEWLLRFDVPAGDLEIFLESRGYYYEWIRPSWLPEESALALALFALNPRGEMRRLAPAYKRIEPDMDRVFWQSRLGAERVR